VAQRGRRQRHADRPAGRGVPQRGRGAWHGARPGHPWWGVSPFGGDLSDDTHAADLAALDPDAIDRVSLDVRAAESYRGETSRAFSQTAEWLRDGWAVVFVTAGHGTAERVAESVRAEGLAVRLVEDLVTAPEPGVVTVVTGELEHGFVAPSLRLAVLTETDLVGQKSTTRDTRRMPTRRRQTIDPLQLKAGDYVVHEQHGVGKYVEMVQRTVAGATREYLVVEYAPAKRGQPGDRLYVPTDQLDQVTRYVGGEAPSLHRLGGADWTKTKAAPARPCARSPASSSGSTRRGWPAADTRSVRTRCGSASSRTRSPTTRRPTSSRASTRSRPTWRT